MDSMPDNFVDLACLQGMMVKTKFSTFSKTIEDNFVENYSDIMKNLDDKRIEKVTLGTGLYNMHESIDYSKAEENLKILYQKLK
jgi:hypothetical protein